MDNIMTIFADNIDRANTGRPLQTIPVSFSSARHRQKKNRGELCSLCCFGAHAPRPVDQSPEFRVLEDVAESARVMGNDPERIFAFFDAFRAEHEGNGFTEIVLYADTVQSEFHRIVVPGGRVPVGGYGSNATEILVDIEDCELAVRVDRLSREARFAIRCQSEREAGLQRRPAPALRKKKQAHQDVLPGVAASAWVHWDALAHLGAHLDRKGCYLIGRFVTPPAEGTGVVPGLIYVGITSDRTLRQRLREFQTSATSHRPGHSGGCEFRRLCVPESAKRFQEWSMPEDVFVRVVSVDCPKGAAHGAAIHDLENRLISAFTDNAGELPLCNRKG